MFPRSKAIYREALPSPVSFKYSQTSTSTSYKQDNRDKESSISKSQSNSSRSREPSTYVHMCAIIYTYPAACDPGGSWQLLVFPRLVYPSPCPNPALLQKATLCHAVRAGPSFLLLPIYPPSESENKTRTSNDFSKGWAPLLIALLMA